MLKEDEIRRAMALSEALRHSNFELPRSVCSPKAARKEICCNGCTTDHHHKCERKVVVKSLKAVNRRKRIYREVARVIKCKCPECHPRRAKLKVVVSHKAARIR
jgi:hypothetical protein